MSDLPTPQQVRRALARAERGAALDLAEATALLAATGDDLDRLCAAAAQGARRRAGRGRPTRRASPTPPRSSSRSPGCAATGATTARSWRRRRRRRATGRRRTSPPTRSSRSPAQGAELGCLEALFTLGDRPEDRWPEAREWLDEQGYDSTLAYVRAMAVRVLEETGLLPHLNPGVMSWEELNRLKPVSPSMGMMLETTSRRLFETKGEAHFGSPDKDPDGPAAGARGRRPAVDPVHHRPAGRHRRDAHRARRDDLRAARARPARTARSRR